MPPGPALAGVLSELDLAQLTGFDCVQVLKAQYRQLSHERARLMVAMVEVGLHSAAGDDLTRMARPDEFSADEIRAALVLTRRAAEAQFSLAHDVLTRLPAAHSAMEAGMLDEPRARVFSEWTAELSPEQARAVCAALLPRAQRLTTGQLTEQIKKMAIAIDPEWAQRRYEQAVAERKVVGYRNPDGSANLSGLNLPLERVAAACGHIDALARSAKHAGDSRRIDHIRADLFLGMTDGTYAGLDDATILEHLRTTSRSHDPRDDEPGHGDACDGGADDARVAAEGECAATGAPSPHPGPSGAGMELRAQLTTLIGQDERPGELAGWGPIHAGLARDLAGLMSRGQWRFVITDHDGHLLHAGFTRARPTGSARRSAGSREIVELQIPATILRELASDPDAQRDPNGDPTRRSPGSVLRRYLQIRDRYCLMIGCRAPARSTDADHTLDYARGGTTTDRNLGHGCRHDHRLKHEGGWRLEQLEPGHFRWISRSGHAYLVHPPPIIDPLPHPIVRSEPALPLVTPPDPELAIWEESPLEGDTGPPPGPSPPFGPHHEPPPF